MSTATLTLHSYQQHAVDFLHSRGAAGAGLLLDMGLGKTAISLTALQPEDLPALVVAPKRVAEEVWPVEVPKWRPDLTVAVAAGSPAKRQKALASGADVVVISRDNLADAAAKEHVHRWGRFIIDELSGFKNRSSIRWKEARRITKGRNHRGTWGLTGTPTQRQLLDLWPQMYLLDGGQALGQTLGGYRARYFTAAPGKTLPSGVVTQWDLVSDEAEAAIREKLSELCVSMSAADNLDLPETSHNTVTVPLPPAVMRVYKAMKDDYYVDLEILGIGGEVHTADGAGAKTGKLQQIAAGFLYADDAELRGGAYDVLHTEKVKALQEIIEGTGSPVVVAYWYKAEREMLLAALGDQAHTMDEPGVVKAWNEGRIPVLLLHPASAGHGLNLQHGGHTLVWYTVPWSLELYQQTNARLPRQGQQHPVLIHHLIAPGTVDEAVMQVLAEKKSVQDALLEHLESPL